MDKAAGIYRTPEGNFRSWSEYIKENKVFPKQTQLVGRMKLTDYRPKTNERVNISLVYQDAVKLLTACRAFYVETRSGGTKDGQIILSLVRFIDAELRRIDSKKGYHNANSQIGNYKPVVEQVTFGCQGRVYTAPRSNDFYENATIESLLKYFKALRHNIAIREGSGDELDMHQRSVMIKECEKLNRKLYEINNNLDKIKANETGRF